MPVALAVHGGAWNIPDEEVEIQAAALAQVLRSGWQALVSGSSALDVVELAVRTMESDPTFNAGRGARVNRAARVELDASIMDGTRLDAGAVAAVEMVRHPVSLARRVMEDTPHVLLVGDGAKRFARSIDAEMCRTRDLLVGRELERYLRIRRGETDLIDLEFRTERDRLSEPMDTVGAVAVDRGGKTAAATSTGGTQDKAPGRAGDSGIIGAGTWADDRIGAVSCTGWGEGILRTVLAKAAADRMASGRSPKLAARDALASLQRIRGRAGIILVDRRGRAAAEFNTPRMARGIATERGGLQVDVDPVPPR